MLSCFRLLSERLQPALAQLQCLLTSFIEAHNSNLFHQPETARDCKLPTKIFFVGSPFFSFPD